MRREKPTSTLLRAKNTTLNVTTVPKARWTQTCQQYHVEETPYPTDQVKHTLSTAARQYINGQQHQKQHKVTSQAGTPAGKTVQPRSCGNKCSVHVAVEGRWTWRNTPGVGVGGIRGRRVWHGTHATRREAPPEEMHPQSGSEGRVRAMSRKGIRGRRGEVGRAAKQERAAREIGVASGK